MVDFSKLIKKNSKKVLEPNIKVGQKILFSEDEQPFNVVARNHKYVICTRKFHEVTDRYFVDHSLNVGAFSNEKEALEYYTGETVYTIMDLQNNIRGTHNLVLYNYNFDDLGDIKKLLSELDSGKTKLSRRTVVNLSYNILKIDE